MSKYSDFNYVFLKMMPVKLHGEIIDKTIYINNNISNEEKISALYEEIGHYYMSAGDISDYTDMNEE